MKKKIFFLFLLFFRVKERKTATMDEIFPRLATGSG
jgi:hypothetical protein